MKGSVQRRKIKRRKNRKRSANGFVRFIILLLIIIIAFLAYRLANQHEAERINSRGFTHAARFDDALVIDGIDVSAMQGKHVDWKTVKAAGVDFVILRAAYTDVSDGSFHKDIMFESHVREAKDAGLMVGAYIFSQAVNVNEAAKEAKFLLKTIDGFEMDLPLVMDYETYAGGRLEKALSAGKLDGKTTTIVKSFCKEVEAKGYESMLYGNMHFLSNVLDGDKLADTTNIWVAHYASMTSYSGRYSFWQCSDNASVSGIPGNVDKDFWYIDTNKGHRNISAAAGNKISISKASIRFKKKNAIYYRFGGNVEPKMNVSHSFKNLREGKDYRLSYIRNSREGLAYVLITGIGEYKDSVIRPFEIKNWL